MANKENQVETVMGWRFAPPKLTFGALIVLVKYVLGPILGGLLLLDILFYLYFQHVLGRCYGILCFFGS